MNRILAVRPGDDVMELHREINAAFYAVGDMTGGHGTHKVLEDIVTGRVAGADRQQAAEELAIYARQNPALIGMIRNGLRRQWWAG